MTQSDSPGPGSLHVHRFTGSHVHIPEGRYSDQLLEEGRLWRLAGEALALNFGSAPGVDCRLTRHSWLVCTGEPLADFNCGIISAHLDATQTLQGFAETFRARKVPFLVCLTPKVAEELDTVAGELGLKFGGSLPLMVLSTDDMTREPVEGISVEHVRDVGRLWEFTETSAKAFGFPADIVGRVLSPGQLDVVGFDMFLLRHEDSPVGVISTTWHDGIVGIWGTGTLPECRRRGVATTLMNHAIAYHKGRGATRFYLLAAPPGRPLYDKLGFHVASTGHVWVGS